MNIAEMLEATLLLGHSTITISTPLDYIMYFHNTNK